VLALNLHRRHLSREQRRELVVTLRQRGWSLRRIADLLGVSLGTVAGDAQVFKTEHLSPTITGADGKQYPAGRPKPKPSVFVAGAPCPQGGNFGICRS
jgi:transposase